MEKLHKVKLGEGTQSPPFSEYATCK